VIYIVGFLLFGTVQFPIDEAGPYVRFADCQQQLESLNQKHRVSPFTVQALCKRQSWVV